MLSAALLGASSLAAILIIISVYETHILSSLSQFSPSALQRCGIGAIYSSSCNGIDVYIWPIIYYSLLYYEKTAQVKPITCEPSLILANV